MTADMLKLLKRLFAILASVNSERTDEAFLSIDRALNAALHVLDRLLHVTVKGSLVGAILAHLIVLMTLLWNFFIHHLK